jgi:hypothetical protein
MKLNNLPVFLIILTAISLTGCNEVELQSQWTEPVALDGSNDADWPVTPQYFDDDSRVRVSMMNDDDHLYIRLLSRDQATRMLFLRGGFTVWLDDSGDTREIFGLQFPLARQNQMGGRMSDHKTRNSMEEMLEDSQYNLAILNGPEETRQIMATSQAAEMGIYARLKIQQGYLIYELKVPLTVSEDNNIIGVGFETGKIERPSGKGSSGGGRGGGGGGGGGRGGGKGGKKMGGKGGTHGGDSPQPIEIWARVHLAENPYRHRSN